MQNYHLFIILLMLPILAILVFALSNSSRILHVTNIATVFMLNITLIILASRVLKLGSISFVYPIQIYLDSLSVLMLGIVLFVGFIISLYTVGYLDREYVNGTFDIKRIKMFYSLMFLFQWTMIIALTAGNMGIMWIAIEATTLSSAFLVGFYGQKSSIEAAWKYVIICSVGIALALLGIVFLHISSVEIIRGSKLELYWPYITEHAGQLNIPALRLSFIFILIGFGTKAGLAPMHTWLPDAHSQAPAPISAMLSGVLLNTSMYGIMRELTIVNKAMGSTAFAGRLLMVIGLLSILIAAIFVIKQKDYKRLLAYSSIEHMGIIALGLGVFTPAAIFAVLFHAINHALTKSLLFLAAGNVYLKYKTREIAKVKGVLKAMPITGTVFLLGIFAITGMPPFSIFSSELSLLIAMFKAGGKYYGFLFLVLLVIVFIGFAVSLLKMFYRDEHRETPEPGEKNVIGAAAICVLLVIITVTGFYLPNDILNLLNKAQEIVSGGKI